jgi:hypothetical protein
VAVAVATTMRMRMRMRIWKVDRLFENVEKKRNQFRPSC